MLQRFQWNIAHGIKYYTAHATHTYLRQCCDQATPHRMNLPDTRIDGPEKMNTISGEFRQEIEDIWSDEIADDAAVKAVVFISGKPDNYIAGADIRMISATKDKADLKKVKKAACDWAGG